MHDTAATRNDDVVLERLSRPGTKARRLQDLLLMQWGKHQAEGTLPTNLRFMLYELEQQGAFSKVRTGTRRSDQDWGDQLTILRERGFILWDDIIDESRHATTWRCAPTITEFVIDSLDRSRIDPWRGVVRPIILCEARTVGGVLNRRLGPEYCVSVAPTNGQSKGFLMTEVAALFRARPARGLYIGDFDLCGNDIERNTRRVLEQDAGLGELLWERVAITEEQTEMLRAQGMEPIQKTDGRFKDKHPHLAYEAEALGQAALEALLRDRLDGLLPEPLDRVLERESQQRTKVARLLRTLTRK